MKYFRMPFLLLIRLYQKTISPDHGIFRKAGLFPYGFCRFKPTCSQYGYDAIKNRGLLVGIPLTFWRILRCNPFNAGGYDPVPKKKNNQTI